MNRIFKYILKYKLWVIIGSLGMMSVIGLDLCIPYLQKEFLDRGIIGGETQVVKPIILILIGITILKALLGL
ncbi:hypothetical protein [uncultured Clostridium sp.]|uniref:hypothetical protein n=1 Tax=uncultured Clostridium sp. TaxID=59620 RepID=UPI0028EB8783|nr:hypothetical protein [uncultured Clostridium sp.]